MWVGGGCMGGWVGVGVGVVVKRTCEASRSFWGWEWGG